MELSCGFIIKTEKGILGCHPTDHEYGEHCFDVPKGHKEQDELPFDAAVRELKEETGIDYYDLKIHYRREFPERKYRNRKIKLFYIEVDKFPFDFEMHCTSTFVDEEGNEKPENDGYKWVTEYSDFYKNLGPLIEEYIEDVRIYRTKLEVGYYRHIESGKLYNLLQSPLFVKDFLSDTWDKHNYVLYRAMYENPDGPYFCRTKKSFIKNFEKISDEEAHAMRSVEKKKRPRIGDNPNNANRLNLN